MHLYDFVKALGRAQDRAAARSTPIEVYRADTGQRFEIATVYTDVDEDRGLVVCVDVEPVE